LREILNGNSFNYAKDTTKNGISDDEDEDSLEDEDMRDFKKDKAKDESSDEDVNLLFKQQKHEDLNVDSEEEKENANVGSK